MIRLALGPEALIHSLILKAKTHLRLSVSNPMSPSSPSSFSSRPSPLSIPGNAYNVFESQSLSYAGNDTGSEFADDYRFPGKLEDLFNLRLDLASMASPNGCFTDSPFHRRSFSVPGLGFGAEDPNSGLKFKPCLYFARGFCKNGSRCRFIHGDNCAESINELDQCQELLISKSTSSSQFMSFPYNNYLNLLLQQQQNETHRSTASPLMMGDELHKYSRYRSKIGANPGSGQIYMTFPTNSTFKEEDVSN